MRKISLFFLFYCVTYILIAKDSLLTKIVIDTNNVTETVASVFELSTAIFSLSQTKKSINHFSFKKSTYLPIINSSSKKDTFKKSFNIYVL